MKQARNEEINKLLADAIEAFKRVAAVFGRVEQNAERAVNLKKAA